MRDENNNFVGPPRVWLPDDNIPGLGMSRSFGDKIGSQVGVIAKPEIMEWVLSEEDKFIMIASDGIWEFMDSEEVRNSYFTYLLLYSLLLVIINILLFFTYTYTYTIIRLLV